MNRFTNIILYALLLSAAAVAPAMAQRDWVKWNPIDGFALRQGYHVEWYRGGEGRDAGQLAGEAAFVWSDCRNGDRGVYVQIVSVEQGLRLKYGANGLRISDMPNRQEDPGVWPTADGGWIIAWEDFDADSLGDIYCTKIDAQGNRLWGEDERGVAVCVLPGIQEDVRIVEDGSGGAIIAWRDLRGGDVGDIYAQRIQANGSVAWQRNGIGVIVAVGPQISHTADSDGEGGMIIAWKDGRNVGNFDIRAQRISPNGALLWGVGQGQGLVVCGTASNQESPKLCPDGAGGAFFSWVDDRNQQQTDKDIYAQRIDANGRLLWREDGEAVCTVEREQAENRIVMSESGNAIILWEDKRADGLSFDVYAMRISGAQSMRKEWQPTTGVPIVTGERNQQAGRLYPDGQGGAYFIWEDERDRPFPELDIWGHRFNRSGQPLWAQNGVPICRIDGQQDAPLVRRTADGGAFFVWGDYRSGSYELWGQKFTPNGQPVGNANGIPLVAGLGGNGVFPKGIERQDGTFTVLWLDGRFGIGGLVPFISNVRDLGNRPELMTQPNGAPALVNSYGGGINPDGCNDEQGGTIVVWEDHRGGQVYSIYAQRIDENGARLWGDRGVKVADFDYEQYLPKVTGDGQGGALVVWKAPTDNDYQDLYMQHLSPQGARLWGAAGRRLTARPMDEEVEQIIPDGSGGFIIVWKVFNDETDDDLRITRVNAGGEDLWNAEDDGYEGGKVLVDEYNKQRSPYLVRHQNGYVVAWVDGRDDGDGQPQYDIYAQFVGYNGAFQWRAGGEVICGEGRHQENPVVAIDNHTYIWIAWEDHRYAGSGRQRDIYIQKMSPQLVNNRLGFAFTGRERDGREVCAAPADQLLPTIIHDGQNGIWLAWEDYRGGFWSDIYATHLQRDGTPYAPWEVNGNVVSAAFHKQNGPKLMRLLPRGDTGAAVVWEDKRATGKEELSNVFIQRLDDQRLSVRLGDGPTAPVGYALEEVFPNPFNGRAVVQFSVASDGPVSLALYDLQSRLVIDFGSEFRSAGKHRLQVDAGSLASGHYILRMEAAGNRVERSLQILK
ncbi:MAG: T9SS type A sorting domain-containing protein [Calditrichaeota bacterium]|nr:T9SS type A sorting domain-containing protein [Calditrichota bacterium]